MGVAQRTPYFQFLANDELPFRAHDLQPADSSALATLQGFQGNNLSERHLQSAFYQFEQLLLRIFHRPLEEVGRLLVVVVQHLPQDMLIVCVAEGLTILVGCIAHRGEIRFMLIFPAILKLFRLPAAAFAEPGIADFTLVGEYLPAGGLHGLCHMGVAGFRDALIALAVVVGTYIEDGVVLTVVPTHDLVLFFHEREETVVAACLFSLTAFLHLSQQPRTRDDGMGLEQL